ncbi:hypothetical protein I317_01081 [Kwoniella heveanensis CBS 569]|nr:hypothetical protein I317_01081 [Kwoniella heveanensis CBS 569]
MPLPFFLQPLLLVSYYYDRLIQKLTGWLQRSNEQLFGPLEQAVAAIVIVGLAMQAPPTLWAPPPPPVIAPVIINGTAQPSPPSEQLTSPMPPSKALPLDGPQGVFDLPASAKIDPINIVIVLLVLNLIGMLIPEELRKRFKESWDLFWPPWQDRSAPSSTLSSHEPRVRIEEPRPSDIEKKSESEIARETKKVVEEAVKGSSKDSRGPDNKMRETKSSSAPSYNSKGSAEANPSSSSASRIVEKPSSSSSARDGEGRPTMDKSATRSEKLSSSKTEEEAADGRENNRESTTDKETDKNKDKALITKTESEHSRSSKSSASSSDASEAAKSKGKARMEGERHNKLEKTARTESEKAREAKKYAESEPKLKSAMTVASSKSASSDSESESGSKTDTYAAPDDALMAGDYRPLRSALKKSKKKPRQHKNIHHNYFMTMRGWRPALIPFPHGFHPKPHYPRNTLWWDNVPRNADHIMAPPPIAKEPEKNDDEDGDEGKDIAKDKKRDEGRKNGTSKGVMDQSEDMDKSKPSAKDTTDKDKEREEAKLKAEADAKAKAKKEAEAKAAASSSRSSSSSAPAPPPQSVPASPKVQKATYMSQALLSIVLFYGNPQLGLLLLTFFVWQFINTHNEAATKLLSLKSSASGSRQVSMPSSTSSSQDGVKSLSSVPFTPDEAKKSTESRTSRPDISLISRATASDARQSTKEGNASTADLGQKVAELEKVIRNLKSTSELTPELQDKPQSAMIKRKQLVAEMSVTGKSSITASSPLKESADGFKKPKVSASELEKKAKEMDDYVRKMRAIDALTDEQKAKLTKADERRRALWKDLRSLQSGGENASAVDKAITSGQDSPPQNLSAVDVKRDRTLSDQTSQLRQQLKEVEMYVMKYRKIKEPTDEQKEKLVRADSKRRALKKELLSLSDQSGVGGSGLSAKDKDGIAKAGRAVKECNE